MAMAVTVAEGGERERDERMERGLVDVGGGWAVAEGGETQRPRDRERGMIGVV